MKAIALIALGTLLVALTGCGDEGTSGPAPLQGTERIIVSVKDSVNGVYTDRVMALDPADSVKLTLHQVVDGYRLVSEPHGGKMAFLYEDDADTSRIFVADIDGRNLHEIASINLLNLTLSFPVLSPDGARLVYSTLDNRLVVENVDGSGRTIIATNAAYETIPDFDAVGNRLAYYGDDDKLYVVNIDGTGLRMVADSAVNLPAGESKVDWSPDGKKLVYVGSDGKGQPDIYVASVDGSSKPVRLTNDLESDLLPTWSPDGAQIAWAGYPGDIYVMNADGSNRRNITPNVSNVDTYPSWSPDGQRLLFIDRAPDAEAGTLRMYDFRTGETKSIAYKATRGFWVKL